MCLAGIAGDAGNDFCHFRNELLLRLSTQHTWRRQDLNADGPRMAFRRRVDGIGRKTMNVRAGIVRVGRPRG